MSAEIAVVIPAFNAAAWLPQTLTSLQQQTLAPKEVVVVDDGSTDDTAAIVRQHGATLVQQQQRGPAAARNRGILATTSPLIAFLDADDWLGPSKLERQSEQLQALGAQVTATDAWVVDASRVVRCKNEGRQVPSVLTLERLLQGNPVICSTVLLRRSALEHVGMFDEDPTLIATEDYDLWLRLAHREPIAYLDEPLTFYRVHAQSLSANARFLRGVDRIMDKTTHVFGNEPHFQRLIERRRAAVRLDMAWDHAYATDRQAPFGGIIIVNQTLGADLAAAIAEIFTEVIIAPRFSDEALAILGKKKNLRLMVAKGGLGADALLEVRSVIGGVLLQDRDRTLGDTAAFKVVTKRQPTAEEWAAMMFGWRVCKHVKSNAIVYCRGERTLGVGAGQMARVDSSRIAVWKAGEAGLDLRGSVVVSEALFPFPDGLLAAADAGATAAIQPGGAIRDPEVIAAADARGMAMVFTACRHFKH